MIILHNQIKQPDGITKYEAHVLLKMWNILEKKIWTI